MTLRLTALIATLGLVALLSACARYFPYFPSSGSPSEDEVVGTWVRDDTALELHEDGTATVTNVPLGVLLDSWRDPSQTPIDGVATWELAGDQEGYGDKYLLLTIDESIHSLGGEDARYWGRIRNVLLQRGEEPGVCIANGDPDNYRLFCLHRED